MASDFELGGKRLSDFGMVLCKFGSDGLETIDIPKITFNTISVLNGSKHELINTEYEDCITTTFQICKNRCNGNDMEITPTEFRRLTQWLCQKKFRKFKLFDKGYMDIYFEATFNVSMIRMDNKLYGLELEMITNRPFALHDPKTITITNTVENGKHSIHDTSYEEGYIYPHTEITIAQNGDLNIYNAIEDRSIHIANCVAGEIITMDYPIIQSSKSSHYIQDDFNWNFFRIANTYENSRNDLTISIPCTIKIEYFPIVKVGL